MNVYRISLRSGASHYAAGPSWFAVREFARGRFLGDLEEVTLVPDTLVEKDALAEKVTFRVEVTP